MTTAYPFFLLEKLEIKEMTGSRRQHPGWELINYRDIGQISKILNIMGARFLSVGKNLQIWKERKL